MKKIIFIIVLAVITLSCIVYGINRNLGDVKEIVHADFDAAKDETSDANSINQSFSGISEIEINAAIMELKLEEGPSFNVSGSFDRAYLKPEVNVKNGTLQVNQKGKKRTMGPGTRKCKVVVTIPRDASLNAVYINSNVGDIKLRDFTARTVGINLNVGEIDVKKVAFENFSCSNNVGKVSVDPEDSIDDYGITASTDVGDVRVDGHSYKRSYNQRGSSSKTIKVNTNVGEVNIR